jgi:pyridinium-3,5-bisthiocarboxylic acid mononucleotide nickel chelatase
MRLGIDASRRAHALTSKTEKWPDIAFIHLDAVGGAAGDMFVACMLDAFPNLVAPVLGEIMAVLPEGTGRPRLQEGSSGGIRALRFGLDSPAVEHVSDPGRKHSHGHPYGDAHHHHQHDDGHHHHNHDEADAQGIHAPRALFPALVELIEGAAIGEGTKGHALAILTRLAEAEAEIHGVPVEQVHFHELADWDSLMDVVAAGSIIAALGPVEWSVSPLPVGGGLVKTQHGLLPVPAPATTLILKGFAMRNDGVPGERVTPTGAAILAHLVDNGRGRASRPSGRLSGTGIGAGTRDMKGLPNILRALVFESVQSSGDDAVDVLEFEVDDMTGEEIGVALERLRRTGGVLDVSTALRMGKKGRPMTEFRLLCADGRGEAVAAACFRQTSTIGLRIRREARKVLARQAEIEGDMRLKRVFRPDGCETRKAESDDLEQLDTLAERRQAASRLEQGR